MRKILKMKLSTKDINELIHKIIRILLIGIALIAISQGINNKYPVEKMTLYVTTVCLVTELLIKLMKELI